MKLDGVSQSAGGGVSFEMSGNAVELTMLAKTIIKSSLYCKGLVTRNIPVTNPKMSSSLFLETEQLPCPKVMFPINQSLNT